MTRTKRHSWVTPRLAIWTGASAAASLANQMLAFALSWTAAGHSPALAGTVLVTWSLPLVALLLVGGVLGDRWGHRRLLITVNLVHLVVACSAGAFLLTSSSPLVLIGLALALGTVQALRAPASGSVVRLFVDDDDLTPALAATTTLTQVVTLAAPPLGGLLVAEAGLPGCLMVLAITLGVTTAAFWLIRPPRDPRARGEASVWHQAKEGIVHLATHSSTRWLLCSVAVVAGATLPVVTLIVPLLGQDRIWDPAHTGLLGAGWTAGSIGIGILTSLRGAPQNPRWMLRWGPGAAAGLILMLVLPESPWPAIILMVLIGAAVRVYTAVAAPLLLTSVPPELIARVQSVLVLVQQIAVLVVTAGLGVAADVMGASAALIGSGLLCAAGAVLAHAATRGTAKPVIVHR